GLPQLIRQRLLRLHEPRGKLVADAAQLVQRGLVAGGLGLLRRRRRPQLLAQRDAVQAGLRELPLDRAQAGSRAVEGTEPALLFQKQSAERLGQAADLEALA